MYLCTSLKALLITFVNVVNQDLTEYFKKISCDTFIFWGDKDASTPLYMAKKLNKIINNSELYIVRNGGHFSYLDDLCFGFYRCYSRQNIFFILLISQRYNQKLKFRPKNM